MDIPKIPTLNISNKALVEMRRNTVAMENFTTAIKSKAGKELLAVIDQYNEVLAIAGTIEDADKYAAKTRKTAEDDAANKLYVIDQRADIHATNIADQNKLLDERSAKLTADIATNDARKVALDNREEGVMNREAHAAEVDEQQEKRNKNHQAMIAGLDGRAAALSKAEADLKSRADRIAAAVA